MAIRPFYAGDVPAFLALAVAEGWICDPWEFTFLLDTFPRGCLAVEEKGCPVAFVTAVRYGTSGWIGNLIVAKGVRRQGYGARLMGRAMGELLAAGVKTVWLTASAEGRPIYERRGFRAVDKVARWSGRGIGTRVNGEDSLSLADMVAMDHAGWGDDRQALLSATVSRGSLLCGTKGFLVVQRCGNGFQFGPWSCGDRRDASMLLARGLALTGEGSPVHCDVPVSNQDAAPLLSSAGFSFTGMTTLMFAGETPSYDPLRIFTLASLGSMG